MCNKTFHNRLYEVQLNESVRGYGLWELLDKFAPGMYYYESCYGCNAVSCEFLRRLPEFRKWAKSHGYTWFRTWEEREAWFESDSILEEVA